MATDGVVGMFAGNRHLEQSNESPLREVVLRENAVTQRNAVAEDRGFEGKMDIAELARAELRRRAARCREQPAPPLQAFVFAQQNMVPKIADAPDRVRAIHQHRARDGKQRHRA